MFRFLKRFKSFFKEHAWKYIIGISFLMFVDVIQLYIPEIIKNLTNEFDEGILTHERLIYFAVLTLLTGLATSLGRFIWRLCIIGSARELEYEVRNKIFIKALSLSQNFFAHNKTGELMALATNHVNAIRMAAFNGLIMAVDASFMLGIVIIRMILNANLRLTLIAVSVFPFLVLFVLFMGRKIHAEFRKMQDSFGTMTDLSQEIFSGIRVVKGFARDNAFIEKFQRTNKAYYKQSMAMIKLRAAFRPTMMLFSAISFLLVLFFGGNAVVNGEIKLGDFIAFNMYLQLMMWPLMAFGMVVNVMQRGIAAMEKTDEFLSELVDITDPLPNAPSERIAQRVEFDRVTFSYPKSNVPALDNVSFVVEKNKSLAIIGTTASGKSTIINLMLRMYDLDSNDNGRILIDGKEVTTVSLKNLRESIAVVPQDNFLFSRSINDNIAFSHEFSENEQQIHKDFSYEYLDDSNVFNDELINEIESVAKIADIHENIINFQNGYNTILGERGVTLSGGQKQRTSIARALLKKPEILILDDSFSAVDTSTEQNILTNLRDFTKSAGLLLISHRISTVKNCDEILVMDAGKIVERGNDTTLMAKKGRYYELAMQQKLEDETSNTDWMRQ